MTEPASFDAILLAGGKSTRFGSDKAFTDWRGQPLYERQLEKLQALGADRIWISANRDQDFSISPNNCWPNSTNPCCDERSPKTYRPAMTPLNPEKITLDHFN